MSQTLSSGLTLIVPSEGDDNWADSITDDCFTPISGHGHTGSGDGKQIVTAAIANLAVTAGKIASDAVTTAKILDGAITEAKLDTDAASRSTLLAFFNLGSNISPISGTSGPTTAGFGTVDNISNWRAPKACKITHLSICGDTSVTGGSITATLFKGGITTSQSVTVSSGANNSAAITAVSLALGDAITMSLSSTSLTGASKFTVFVFGHFTE